MPNSLTITLENWHIYLFIKILIGMFFLIWERQYIRLSGLSSLKRFCFLACLNPEWLLSKLIIALPIWLVLGYHINLSPIKKDDHYSCSICNDTGIVKDHWWQLGRQCSCSVRKYWSAKTTNAETTQS